VGICCNPSMDSALPPPTELSVQLQRVDSLRVEATKPSSGRGESERGETNRGDDEGGGGGDGDRKMTDMTVS